MGYVPPDPFILQCVHNRNMSSPAVLNLNLTFYLAYIQHNTTDTKHMLIMNARTPVITKIVDATGRPLKLQNTVYL